MNLTPLRSTTAAVAGAVVFIFATRAQATTPAEALPAYACKGLRESPARSRPAAVHHAPWQGMELRLLPRRTADPRRSARVDRHADRRPGADLQPRAVHRRCEDREVVSPQLQRRDGPRMQCRQEGQRAGLAAGVEAMRGPTHRPARRLGCALFAALGLAHAEHAVDDAPGLRVPPLPAYKTESAACPALSAWLASNARTGKKVREEPPEDRITRSAWFTHKHDEVPAAAWKRPAVKGASNCAACHAQADREDGHRFHWPTGLAECLRHDL